MKKIFITGASGTVGQYVVGECLKNTDYEVHCMVRDRNRLGFPDQDRLIVHIGNMLDISKLKDVIHQMNFVIHIATPWGGDVAFTINVDRSLELFSYCDPDRLEKIIYFSTASILGPGSKAQIEAKKFGSGYVRSKYLAHKMFKNSPVYPKLVTVFPTLVFGGGGGIRWSHISSGVAENKSLIKWLKWMYIDASFHFLHCADIAQVTVALLSYDGPENEFVLGQKRVFMKEMIRSIAKVYGYWVPFQIKLPVEPLLRLLKWKGQVIKPWDQHCIDQRHLVFDTVNPETFGLVSKFPDLKTLIQDIKDNY